MKDTHFYASQLPICVRGVVICYAIQEPIITIMLSYAGDHYYH